MSTTCWAIDAALRLHRIDGLPSDANAKAVDPPEQSMDVVLLRNLDLLTTDWLGSAARFVFHSTDYWGPFDVGCVLQDGRIVAFENKSASLNKQGFGKFCCDIVLLRADARNYLEHRFDHVRAGLDYYIQTARRMFAGFFLGLRADTEPLSRDLAAEAAELFSPNQEQFHANFENGNGYLEVIRHCTCFDDYIRPFTDRTDFDVIVPVLLVPETLTQRVQGWFSNLPARQAGDPSPAGSCPPAPSGCWRCAGGNGTNARLAAYRFYARDGRFPEWLCTYPSVEFRM